MSEQQQDLEKSEQPSAHKLHKAHERGSIVKSADVVLAVVLLVAVVVLYGLGEQLLREMAAMMADALPRIGREPGSASALFGHLIAIASRAAQVIAPVVFVIWTAAVLAAALQARGVLSTQPLQPDFSRLNPANGFKRVFSMKSMHELLKSFLKLAVVTGVCALWGFQQLDKILRAGLVQAGTLASESIELLASLVAMLAGLFVVLAFIDYGFNRWDFRRQMRMSKKEVKDEHKEREGDPRIKARLRELRMEWLRRSRSVAKVRSADVLLTNPTHYAVALEYRQGQMPAPIVSAKGAGELAHRMRAEARRHGVPVVENPPLARALFALKEDQFFVPEEHFVQVARILRWVYAARSQPAARGIAA